MEENRPNPDAILKEMADEKAQNNRGKLKIFFGYVAGVGKTYAMLEAAHVAKENGIDVVAGYIEPHARPETLALIDGIELLPNKLISHKDIILKEFDIDLAIERKPQLILVDELAHTNADGSRHIKRYQDIEELLKQGIDVYTTVNVQHLESLNDIVASITGVVVKERLPDPIFDNAYQVELVDIEPEELIERLSKGKIYKPKQAQKALGNFFTKENLVALREIALRRTADRVNKVAEKSKPVTHQNNYFTSESILICLSSSPSNAKVIRTAARMANAFHGVFTALFVETPYTKELSDENHARLRENLNLAQQLGAKISTVYGEDVPFQIAEYAKVSGISKIVIGRSNNKKHIFLKNKNFIDRLTELAPNLDIYVIPDSAKPYANKHNHKIKPPQFSLKDTAKTVLILAAATIIGFWFEHLGFTEANIIIVYLLGVLFTAVVTAGQAYSVIASLLSVLIFNFFFTYPKLSLQAYDPSYPVTFATMFLAAFLTSTLTKRIKQQAHEASLKAYRTEILLQTSQKLQRAKDKSDIISRTAFQMIKLLERAIIFYPVNKAELDKPIYFSKDNKEDTQFLTPDEYAVAQWVFKNNKHAGASTNTLPGAKCLYMAVRSNKSVFAVVAIEMQGKEPIEAFERNLLLAMLSECAMALEKENATETKNQLSLEAKQEQLRANLLRAISHDLRTPLTGISGNAGILMSSSAQLNEDKKQSLYADIFDDSMWLTNLVENLLSVTRIENGTMNIKTTPELLQEVIDEALLHINRKSVTHNIKVDLQDDLLMAKMDSRLIIQVIINIVDNAIKYTDETSDIIISANRKKDMVEICIADNGNGIEDDAKEKLFDMFYTLDNARGDGRRGLGLGLSLCKSIINAHGGNIYIKDNFPKGSIFCFTLKCEEVNINE